MFSKAYAEVSKYTRPLIVLKRQENGEVTSGVATFMLLNKEGWALTAGHAMIDAAVKDKDAKERDAYQKQFDAIQNDTTLSPGKKRHEIGKLRKNFQWITHLSYWWAADGINVTQIHIDPVRDLAVAKLTGADVLGIATFPQFAPANVELLSGTSLCRLGFPFHTVNGRFDDASQQFKIDNMPQLAMFPNEGIHTRIMLAVDQTTQKQAKFLETSSPGLRGQSGGPIFDVNGRVWAVQSKTLSLQLGFAPIVKQGNRQVVEHQFMHIGVGSHIDEIRAFFGEFKVPFESAP
jgi:hypothetical protein